jgi:hypothetical protein
MMEEITEDAESTIKGLLQGNVLSQLALRMFCSEISKLILEKNRKSYNLLPSSVIEHLELLVQYKDNPDVCFDILEQHGVYLNKRMEDISIAEDLANTSYKLWISYIEAEFYFESSKFRTDEILCESVDYFLNEADEIALEILSNCNTKSSH